ncbi:MAG TPA: OmpA family protein [Flavobacteriales bacterium]|nr:OmpA family protein [Flavobacteriales bacterium]HIA10603.1 OmpA family protein [Flavobacteriales bacterium]HIO71975.1 OmpA family protein [Flavobacteriales bacterium]
MSSMTRNISDIKLPIVLLAAMLVFHTGYTQELTPTYTEAVLNVTVVSEAGSPPVGDTIRFVPEGAEDGYYGVTDESGKFSLLIPNNKTYEARFKNSQNQIQKASIPLPGNEKIVFDFKLNYELPRVYTLDQVFFATGKAILTAVSFKELNELVEVMKFKTEMKIEIGGHTDDVGEDSANQRLSESRANAVRNYLIKNGIEGDRVSARGYGETKPVAYNTTPEGRQKNRRTEVRILSQ